MVTISAILPLVTMVNGISPNYALNTVFSRLFIVSREFISCAELSERAGDAISVSRCLMEYCVTMVRYTARQSDLTGGRHLRRSMRR